MRDKATSPSIKKNFIYQISYNILLLVVAFVLSPYLARVLGAEALGIYAYHYVIADYFVLFSVLGLKNHGKRVIAQCRDDRASLNRAFSNLLTLHVLVSVICLAVYGVYVTCWASDQVYALIMMLIVLSGLLDIDWFYFGLENFKMTVVRSIVIKLITIVMILVCVNQPGDLWIYCLIMSAGILANQLALWFPLHRYVDWVRPEKAELVRHFKPLVVLFIPTLAISLYKQMDKIMIGGLSDHTELGYYDNAEKFVNIPLMVITSFGSVMLPRMANLMAHHETKTTERYTRLSFYYVMWLTYACAFGLMGIARGFAPIFWGRDFEPAGVLIVGLAVTLPFVAFANIIRTQYLIPSEHDNAYIVSVSVGAGLNLLLNAILIPTWGALGATLATIVAEVAVCLLQAFAVRKLIPIRTYFMQSLCFLPMGAVMALAVYFIGEWLNLSVWTLLIQLFVGAGLYLAISVLYFYKVKDPWLMAWLKKRKNRS